MDVSWTDVQDDPTLLSFQQLNAFTELVAPYIHELMTQEDEGTLDERVTLDVTMNVLDHTVTNKRISIQSTVTMWYVGHEPVENLAREIDQAIIRHNGLPTILGDAEFIQSGASEFLISLSSVPQDSEVLYSFPSRDAVSSKSTTSGLVAVVICLVLALIFVSAVLFWYAGGCPVFKEKMKQTWTKVSKWCSSRPSEEKDDAATSASGILGANPSYSQEDETGENAMPASFTPHRGVFREQDCDDSQILSPVSTNTDFSTTSRAIPLGIQPSLHLRATPQKPEMMSTNPYKRDKTYS